jgi:hypothetical protein
MKLVCKVHEPMNAEGVKKYINLDIGVESLNVKQIHSLSSKPVKNLIDPLDKTVLRVKVPFRYNRVMCKVTGAKTLQELASGDTVNVELKYCGWWESDGFGGPSWKLVSACQV